MNSCYLPPLKGSDPLNCYLHNSEKLCYCKQNRKIHKLPQHQVDWIDFLIMSVLVRTMLWQRREQLQTFVIDLFWYVEHCELKLMYVCKRERKRKQINTGRASPYWKVAESLLSKMLFRSTLTLANHVR